MTEIEHRRNECRDAEYGLELEAAREELAMNRARIAKIKAINADLLEALEALVGSNREERTVFAKALVATAVKRRANVALIAKINETLDRAWAAIAKARERLEKRR